MSISQTCGFCGSSFDVSNQREVALWREWVANHRCESMPEVTETAIMTSADTSHERIGFQVRSLLADLPNKPGWEDD